MSLTGLSQQQNNKGRIICKRVIGFTMALSAIIVIIIYYVDVEHLSQDFPAFSILSTTQTKPMHYTRAKKTSPLCMRRNDNTTTTTQGKQYAKSFLMVFMSRSGSTAISQTLNMHPKIDNKLEWLENVNVKRGESLKAINMTEEFFQESMKNGKIPGFKIRAHFILDEPEKWASLVKKYDTRIIWQYRKNVFKTSLGIYRRVMFNDYTATGGIKVTDISNGEKTCEMGIGCSFRIDDFARFHEIVVSRILQDIDVVKAVRVLDGDRGCVFEMPYEDYLYYKTESMRDLFGFLGLDLYSVDTWRAKATSDSMCQVIQNFDQLCETFYGCPYWQPFLDDFENDCRCTNFTHSEDRFCTMEVDEGIQPPPNTNTTF